jgi:hypothetical protein
MSKKEIYNKGDGLLFVYNADSNLYSKVFDFTHKILSPNTYPCSLCSISYGNFRMKKEWTDFLKSLKTNLTFLHKDEFLKAYPDHGGPFPCVFTVKRGTMRLLLTKETIDSCSTLQNLIEVMKRDTAQNT